MPTTAPTPRYPDPPGDDRAWVAAAVADLLAEAAGAPDTPMHELRLVAFPDIRFLLKDESVHPSGSLKHRLARSLFLHALCSGRLGRGHVAIDASSGSTAISEAWFARRLGIAFTAVMPRATAAAKRHAVVALGGQCDLVDDPAHCAGRAQALAARLEGCHLDQFGLAASATDWRGNNNIAQSLLEQCAALGVADPAWIVCGAGTGGTSSTIGRYLRYAGGKARLCVAEPTGGAFARGWRTGDRGARATAPTWIEGIGRREVEPCFAFEVVDRVIEVDDARSIGACLLLEHFGGGSYGGSSGTNLAAAVEIARGMQARGETGSIVLLLCDGGDRYADTLFSGGWQAARGLDPGSAMRELMHVTGDGAVVQGRTAIA